MKAVIVLLTVIFVGLTGCATKRNLTQQEQLDAARAGQAPKTTTRNRFGTMTTCNSY